MWIALTRTAADAYVNLADDFDLHFINKETEMNKFWLLTLVLETVQCTCNGNGTHENETQQNSIIIYIYFMSVGVH